MTDKQPPTPTALDALAAATTAAELATAHRRARAAILKSRKAVSANTRTLMEMLDMRRQMKADGASDADITDGMSRVLRQIWPNVREWKYECHRCNDTGLVIKRCTPSERCDGVATRIDHWRDSPGKYHRLCAQQETDYEHDYGVPCWCQRGKRFMLTTPTNNGDDITKAARSKKMTRF